MVESNPCRAFTVTGTSKATLQARRAVLRRLPLRQTAQRTAEHFHREPPRGNTSAVRSTVLAGTLRPASRSIWRRPGSNGASEPTSATMRRTPGDRSVFSMSTPLSEGQCP